ncbi:MAG TPA: DUF2378 family protein [Polyangiaceae bacterium]|jgi:uncharacterized protein (TIGR02265 family)|nr:DUF2378 family protein [Polyangiaceae bacterium]
MALPHPGLGIDLAHFREPPWQAPLDVPRALSLISADSSIAGMFFLAVVEGAKRRGVALSAPRERYLPFGFYPVAEFAPLLVAAAGVFHPKLSLRQALRAIGAAGPAVLAKTVLGKVTLGSAIGVHAVIDAIVKTYSVNIRPCRASVTHQAERACVVSLDNVQHFLDSHHVGVLEGTMTHAGVQGRVRIASKSEFSADLLLEW